VLVLPEARATRQVLLLLLQLGLGLGLAAA
jgi:hypothetical protein